MRDRLFKLLGIESGEESMISMLLTQSVFLGIFFGAFDISAHSLFLSIFDEKMMARGYVMSGLAGIILTSIYTGFQARVPFRNFSTINLVFVTAFTLFLWVLLLLKPANWIVFLVFIMLGPLNILAMLGFWGTVGRLFTLRQGKRLFGLVDAGLIIGVIISCYAIPVLLSFNFKSHNILLISAAAVLTGSVIQGLIGKRFHLGSGKSEVKPEKAEKKKSLLSLFREDNYVRIMSLFIALSVMTAFFVQYSFMAVTREQYPAEEDMARFLGLFTGSMMIFTLLIKLLVFSYLIRNYGLRTCLALSPVLVAAFTLIAVLVGLFMGFTPAATGFMLFFMLLALSRLFSKSLKDSIESPSFKVIYQTIDEKIRYEVQSGMDGTVNEIAALSSGLILAGLGILSFIKLIHFSLVLFVLTLLWMFVAFKLYSGYRNSIRKALETGGDGRKDSSKPHLDKMPENKFSAGLVFRNEYFNIITGDPNNLVNSRNSLLISVILDQAEINKDVNLLPVLKRLASDADTEQHQRKRAVELAESLEHNILSGPQKEEKILNAQKILSDSRQPQTTQILRLLRDNSIESKRYAVYMIGKFRLTDMISEVCGCLNIPGLETDAKSVLRSFGRDADEELSRYYLVTSGNNTTSKTILRLLGENRSNENQGFLFSRLWSNSRQVKEIALKCLIENDFRSSEEDKDRLHQLISDIIGIMVWNLSAKISLNKRNETMLLDALDKDISRWYAFLFDILSITYDSGSISRIRENLESGTVESVNYALEMIDMVIDESVKPKLIPLLDIIPDEDKVKHLYQFYPGEIPEYQQLVEGIINRDYNLLGIWTRTCAIRNMTEIENENMTQTLLALLFSPEPVLREEAAKLIGKSNKELYRAASSRIPLQIRTSLDKVINGELKEGDFHYEKVRFLNSFLTGTNEEYLLVLAESLEYFTDIQNIPAAKLKDSVLWSGIKGQPDINVEINNENLKPFEGRHIPANSSYCYVLPLNAVEKFFQDFPEQSSGIINYIENIDRKKNE